jgi:hypothetical protein
MRHTLPQLSAVLAHISDWQFNSFELAEASYGRPLSLLSFYLFKQHNLINQLQLNEVKLARYLMRIEDGCVLDPLLACLLACLLALVKVSLCQRRNCMRLVLLACMGLLLT